MREYVVINLETAVREAFSSRARPRNVVPCDHPNTTEYTDALHFQGRDWRDTNCDLWSKFSDAIYGFCPEAFCYFLPGIIYAQVREDEPELLLNSSLIGMLDRSENVEYWDAFFIERWPRLNRNECLALQEWVLWISSKGTGMFSEASLTRAFSTLNILASKAK
jgi:hypothetical protein